MRQLKGIVERVISSPRLFIILPASIAFILSYPFLYTFLTVSLPIKNLETPIHAPPWLGSDGNSALQSSTIDASTPILNVKQIYISPPLFSNALSQQVLESIAPLIASLSAPSPHQQHSSQRDGSKHRPNDQHNLKHENSASNNYLEDKAHHDSNDKSSKRYTKESSYDDENEDEDGDHLPIDFTLTPRIKTLPYLHYYTPSSHNDHFALLSLKFSSPSLNSVLYLPRPPHYDELKASGILISYFYNDSNDEKKWNDSIENFAASQSSTLVSELESLPSFILPTSKPRKKSSFSGYVRSLPFSFFPHCPLPLINIIVSTVFLAFYVNISWDVSSVRSKFGLFVAFAAQIILSFSSSVTIVSYIFSSFSYDSLRHFLIVPYFILILSVENISRLLNAVAHTPTEKPPAYRITTGALASFDKSFKSTFSCAVALLLPCIPWLHYSPQVVHICVFAIFSIFLDLLLHVTYFTAVLSIDLRRFELEDLLTESLASNHQPSKYYLKFINADEHFPESVRPYYLYLRHLYFHPKLSLSTFILLLAMSFLTLWNFSTDSSNLMLYSSGRMPFFFSQLTSSSPIFSQHAFVRIFEPIVLQGTKHPFLSSTSKIEYFLGPSILGSYSRFMRIISINIILELAASIAFILSLTGVILKYVLPPRSERSTSTESTHTIEFFSKDLVGFHTLDVLRVVVEGPAIGTVSLDHKICVWNASSAPGNRMVKPMPVPLATEFWPVTRMVLNSQVSMVAIFSSRVFGIRCWDYKNNALLYHIQDNQLFNTAPIETFFSGQDLIVVTGACSVVSISETGKITQFPIEFPSKTSQVIHARRLLTPRIPERIISMSSENEISIGTHIGRAWRFRRLMIQESPIQFTLHTLQSQGGVHVHDLSKYKPQPIPAPQAMMARNPMRANRLSAVNRIPNIPPIRRPKILDEKVVALVPVPAINMVLIATAVHVCLFDAQTGIIVKHFEIGHLKPSSLRAFHSQPTHCRFCGCVSVDTFSIAYSDHEQEGLTICHTLTIDNRAKNSICIRVERDPRETRCLGFEATTERQHWIDKVEGWDTTDMNMIMGVRRKEPPFYVEEASQEEPSNALMSFISKQSDGIRRRRVASGGSVLNGSTVGSATSGAAINGGGSSGYSTSGKGYRSQYQKPGRRSSAPLLPPAHSLWNTILDILAPRSLLELQAEKSQQRSANQSSVNAKPTLNMTWEGWAMSATGQVTYYDIPDFDGSKKAGGEGGKKLLGSGGSQLFGQSSAVANTIGTELDNVSFDRLLISSIGPVTKYGAKSIAVAFGNVIKVLYFGNEESLVSPAPQPMTGGPTVAPKQQQLPPQMASAESPRAGAGPGFSKIAGAGGPPMSAALSGSRKWRREVGY